MGLTAKPQKPMGGNTYGSIRHLPESRRTGSDLGMPHERAEILTVNTRDECDFLVVQEKLDGANVAAANINGRIVALNRPGYLARSSPHIHFHMWADWVDENAARFKRALLPGEWMSGEWLKMAHGTRYKLPHEPFVAFDVFRDRARIGWQDFKDVASDFVTPAVLHAGPSAFCVGDAERALGAYGFHGALDPCEGAVWRLYRSGRFDFAAKYVRQNKVDGRYLPSVAGGVEIWNQVTAGARSAPQNNEGSQG